MAGVDSQDAAVGEESELDARVEPFEGEVADVELLLANSGGVGQSVHVERAQHWDLR